MPKQIESLPAIIAEAAKNPLGTLALMAIIIGVLAYRFFGTKSNFESAPLVLKIRLAAFLIVLSGVCAFGRAVVLTFPSETAIARASSNRGAQGPETAPGGPVPAVEHAASGHGPVSPAKVTNGNHDRNTPDPVHVSGPKSLPDGDPMGAYRAIRLAEFNRANEFEAWSDYKNAYALLPQAIKRTLAPERGVADPYDLRQIQEALRQYQTMFDQMTVDEIQKLGSQKGEKR